MVGAAIADRCDFSRCFGADRGVVCGFGGCVVCEADGFWGAFSEGWGSDFGWERKDWPVNEIDVGMDRGLNATVVGLGRVAGGGRSWALI